MSKKNSHRKKSQKRAQSAKKASAIIRESYIEQIEEVKGTRLSDKQKEYLRTEYKAAKTKAQRAEFVATKGLQLKREYESKPHYSAGGDKDTYCARFAESAKIAQEIVQKISPYADKSSSVNRVISIANEIINYSTSDDYGYDTVKEENKENFYELEAAVEDAINDIQESYDEEGNQTKVDSLMLSADLDELQVLLDRLSSMTTPNWVTNSSALLLGRGGSLAIF